MNKKELITIKRTVYTDPVLFAEQNRELYTNLPYAEDTSVLKAPLRVGNLIIPNRLAAQAMEGCDGTADGRPDTLTKRRYKRVAEGGVGLLWFEATAVLPEGRANPRQLYINEANLDDFKRQVEEIKEEGLKTNGYEPVVVMQATHSGRYSKPEGKPAPLIAYNNPIFEKDAPISADRIVTDEYLDRVQEALVHGAVLAERAGFDGVDIKACHRYLISELLASHTREGKYGGSFENRIRFILEVIDKVRAAVGPDFIIASRYNVYDAHPYPYGFGVDQEDWQKYDLTEPVALEVGICCWPEVQLE